MSDEDDFDIRLWCIETKLTETGIKKLAAQDIVDKAALLCMSDAEILSIKLGAGDRGKLNCGIQKLRPAPVEPAKASPVEVTDNQEPSGASAQNQDQPDLPPVQSVFSIEEVASFLSGRPVPEALQQSMNALNIAGAPVDSIEAF
jgi:hypothetical protein